MKFSINAPVSCCFAIAVGALALSHQVAAQESAAHSSALQQSRLIEFDAPVPGQLGTYAYANNDEGAVVGFYTDGNVVPHGFLRTPAGKFVSFDAPGAGLGEGLDQGTVAYSINDLGVIAGQFEDPFNNFHAFLRYPDGKFVVFDAPGAGSGTNQGTLAYNVNLEGAAAGIYIDSMSNEHGFVRGFFGEVATFDPPGSIATMVCEETCLNVEGESAGFYFDSNSMVHGFLRESGGKIISFDGPNAGTAPFAGTYAASINAEGEITGYTLDSNYLAYGFTRSRDGKFTSFQLKQASTAPGEGSALLDQLIWRGDRTIQ